MNHPFLDKPIKAFVYTIFWIAAIFVCQFFPFANPPELFEIRLTENILLCFIQYAISIGLWYVIKYNRIEEKKNSRLLSTIIFLGIATVLFWIFFTHFMISIIFEKNQNYISYFAESIKNKTLTSIILYSTFTLTFYLIIYYHNFKENIIRQNQLMLQLKQQELAQLKAQINPHFLFNSLNSISYMVYDNQEKAHEAIIKLSEYFRLSLQSSAQSIHLLEKEIENAEKYLEIEKYRFENKLEIKIEVDELCKNVRVPAMILQPIIENAVKHGVYESSNPIFLQITAKNTVDQCIITIKNNFEESLSKPKGNGLGLKNTAERLSLHYLRNDLLSIEKTENQFKVTIAIPTK